MHLGSYIKERNL